MDTKPAFDRTAEHRLSWLLFGLSVLIGWLWSRLA
jgi:hypothetical protein